MIAADLFGLHVNSVRRFPTGNQHFVYDVDMAEGHRVVVRLSRVDDRDIAQGAVYWSKRLRPLGVPLPEILHADLEMDRHPFPFVVLERLPGDDLGIVYDRLDRGGLRTLAARLVAIQSRVATMPEGSGFGYVLSYEGPFLYTDWREVIAGQLARSRRRIRAAGVVGESVIDEVAAMAGPLENYLAAVRPVPFLHDITTKNVMIDRGRLSGIVDVDSLCFGDPLFLLGLIRMALVAHGRDPVYVRDWIDLLGPDREQLAALELYTAVHCVGFMSELGHRFNRVAPEPVDPAYLERLRSLHANLIAGHCR